MLPKTHSYNCFEYLSLATEKYGDLNMLQYNGSKYRRSQFFYDTDRLAAYFQKTLKLKRGDIYTVFMPTTIQAITAFYALNKIGVSVNFVHPLMPAAYLEKVLSALNSKGVMLTDFLAKKHISVINNAGIPCLICSSTDYLKGTAKPFALVGEKLIGMGLKKLKNRELYKTALKTEAVCNPVKNNGDDVAVFLNGGGTTGDSKTIKLSSKVINELAQKTSHIQSIYEKGDEAIIALLPLFHCFGLCLGMHMALCSGARLIPMMKFNPKKYIRLMRKNHIVGAIGIPLMFRKLMEADGFEGKHLKNLKFLFCGGDSVSDSFLDEFNSYLERQGAQGRLRQGYGLTETAGVCCVNTNEAYRRSSIGKPLPGIEMKVLDERRKSLPPGEIGEIAISGSTVMQGYHSGDVIEASGLYEDARGKKWVLSGDLGYRDADGFFYFTGRKKRVIIIAGYNIYPGDMENKLRELPFIKEVCAVEGKQGEKTVIRIFASLKEKGKEDKFREIIRQTCKRNFPVHYSPGEIIFLEDLPHTQLMKTDYRKLMENKHILLDNKQL